MNVWLKPLGPRDNCVDNDINKPDSQLVEKNKIKIETQQILPVRIIYNVLNECHRGYDCVAKHRVSWTL